MASAHGPVGVFDSGVGGLSVWREILQQLPCEDTLYVADQANVPYGPRSQEQIRAFSRGITRFLLAQGAKLIVVACNTASGAALSTLRQEFPGVPFVGMEPAVKPAVEHTHSGSIGIIATPTTFEGELFHRLVERYGGAAHLHTQTCPGLVEAVEAGDLDSPETYSLLTRCLTPLVDAGIDQLVLGCTHYPFLADAIRAIVGPDVVVVDPSPAVARQAGRILEQRNIAASRAHHAGHSLYTSGSPSALAGIAGKLTGFQGPVRQLAWVDGALEVRQA